MAATRLPLNRTAPAGFAAPSTPPVVKVGVLRTAAGAGNFRVTGTVTVEGTPAQRRVALLDRQSLVVEGVEWSSKLDGSYTFNFINDGEKVVIALDLNRVYDPIAKDAVTPEIMPL